MGAPKKLVPVNKVCEACGETFRATTSYQIRIQRFCSRKCRTAVHGNGRAVERTLRACLNCGKEMQVLPCHLQTKRFCSYSCGNSYNNRGPRNAAWKGGVGNRGKYWKRQARKRDDFTCQMAGCGKRHKGKGTHAHHKIPRSVGGDDSLDNLITLCSRHHKEIEGKLLERLVQLYPAKSRSILEELYDSLCIA